MTIKIPNGGEVITLRLLVNNGLSPEDLVIKLFNEDYTPQDTDTAATYAPWEATFTGYLAETLSGATWIAEEGNPSVVSYAQRQFICSAVSPLETIYGYWMQRLTGGELVLAERFANPVPISIPGNRVVVEPRIEASDTSD